MTDKDQEQANEVSCDKIEENRLSATNYQNILNHDIFS